MKILSNIQNDKDAVTKQYGTTLMLKVICLQNSM